MGERAVAIESKLGAASLVLLAGCVQYVGNPDFDGAASTGANVSSGTLGDTAASPTDGDEGSTSADPAGTSTEPDTTDADTSAIDDDATAGSTGAAVDLEAGLVAHWRFDDGEGTQALDDAPAGSHGTVEGNPTWVDGRIGGALAIDSRDGVPDAIVVAPSPVLDVIGGSFTVAAWVRPEDGANGDGWTLIYREGSGTRLTYSYGQFKWSVFVDATTQPSTSSGVVAPGEWIHVAGVYDVEAATITLYLDGLLAGAQAFVADGPALAGDSWTLARGDVVPDLALFDLDDARIYDRALSAAEVEALAF